MIAELSRQRLALAVAACVAGIAAFWITEMPPSLLVPVAAVFLYARGRTVLILYAICATAFTGLAFAAFADTSGTRDLLLSWSVFFALALCIGAIVTARGSSSFRTFEETAVSGSPSFRDIHPDDRAAAERAMAYAFWTGVPQVQSYRQRQADGIYRLAEFRAEPGYGVSVDVNAMVSRPNERWTTSEAVGETAEAIAAAKVIESLYGKAWAFDADGHFTYVTPVAQTAIGMTLDDLNAPVRGGSFVDGGDVGWSRGVHPDDYEAAAGKLRNCLKTGEHWNVEYRMLRANGQYVWHRIAARPSRDSRGRITGWYGTSIDIDVYKKTEAALLERERDLSQLVDMVPSHLWRLTPDGEPTFFNKRMIDFLGLDVSGADRPGMTRLEGVIETIVHPDDAPELKASLNQCLVTGEKFSMRYRLRRSDGVYRWVEGRAEPMRESNGRIVRWYGLCHDIDDQIHAEDELRRSEARLQQLVDAVPAMMWTTSRDGVPTYLNKRYVDVVGVALDGLTAPDGSPSPLAVCHPDDKAAAAKIRARAFEDGGPYVVRYRQLRHDGSYRWTETRAEALRDKSDAILEWYGVAVDIHDMVVAQEALQETERSLRQLVETLPALIYCAAPSGEPTYRSRQLREFLGFNVDEKEGAGGSRLAGTLDAVIHPDDLAVVKTRYARSLSTGDPYALRHRLRRADGEYRWVETRAAPMRAADGAIVQWNGICLDIEDQVRAQEQLRAAQETLSRASQAASLAELSASIAHEVNQPLAAVIFNSNACQRWLQSDPPNIDRAQVVVERIIRDANSAADVVSRIRALFKQSAETRSCAPIDDVIVEARDLMAQEASRNSVRLDIQMDKDIPSIEIDRVQIQQVLVNLIRNGVEAMASDAYDRVLQIRVRPVDGFVQTEVRDRGPGIAFPQKIFEPFFTTKQTGMGMGLTICRSIVESHGGQLWAEKNQPQGAAFVFTLPVTSEEAL